MMSSLNGFKEINRVIKYLIEISMRMSTVQLVFIIFLQIGCKLVVSAPQSKSLSHTWPYLPTYDIWGSGEITKKLNQSESTLHHFQKPQVMKIKKQTKVKEKLNVRKNQQISKILADNEAKFRKFNNFSHVKNNTKSREGKVLSFFPLSVDDECLADDGRRIGVCLNAYECRIQGGSSRGTCAFGFGVCCIYEATCGQEISNNVTYFVSPNFPAHVSKAEECSVTVRLLSNDISQIRLDFVHFTLGQPNRATGVCENDIFSIEGGPTPFWLCGQNNGQHIYYDVAPGGRANDLVMLFLKFGPRSFASRLWEIRVVQIPFSQRAPSGCLQYFTGNNGVIQTFNFAENGRHLANQNYRACIRQESGMCSIAYEPCDDQSFRISPNRPNFPGGNNGFNGGQPGGALSDSGMPGTLADDPGMLGQDGMPLDPEQLGNPQNPQSPQNPLNQGQGPGDGAAADDPGALGDDPGALGDDPGALGDDPGAMGDDPGALDQQADETQADDATQADEGSGGDGGGFFGFPAFPSFPSFPSFGSFFGRSSRSMRTSRQLYSPCVDRITMPCIVEDFIGAGMGDLPTCIPVHCGNSMCQSGVSSCKVESTVTPFSIGVHFGNATNKGSPEDNIGACLRFNQSPCSES